MHPSPWAASRPPSAGEVLDVAGAPIPGLFAAGRSHGRHLLFRLRLGPLHRRLDALRPLRREGRGHVGTRDLRAWAYRLIEWNAVPSSRSRVRSTSAMLRGFVRHAAAPPWMNRIFSFASPDTTARGEAIVRAGWTRRVRRSCAAPSTNCVSRMTTCGKGNWPVLGPVAPRRSRRVGPLPVAERSSTARRDTRDQNRCREPSVASSPVSDTSGWSWETSGVADVADRPISMGLLVQGPRWHVRGPS